MLLSGGDLVTSGTAFLDAAASAVGGLSGSTLTAAVMGDHDHWSAPGAIRALHGRAGWMFLDDRHQVFTVRGRTVLLTGLTYIYSRRKTDEELDEFLGSAPRADLRLLLVHQPAERGGPGGREIRVPSGPRRSHARRADRRAPPRLPRDTQPVRNPVL